MIHELESNWESYQSSISKILWRSNKLSPWENSNFEELAFCEIESDAFIAQNREEITEEMMTAHSIFFSLFKVGNKDLRWEEQNKFIKKITSNGIKPGISCVLLWYLPDWQLLIEG